ncbi:MAG: nitroreductase family protein [Actinobacteria bacterium]|nr:nitroreductase family protein [Actinomycetota bacterium]
MEFRDLMRKRRMVRRFRREQVPPDALQRIAAAAHRGPSAGFAQGVSVVVVTDPTRRARIADLAGEAAWRARGRDPWLSAAPAHLVLCVEPGVYRARYAEADKDPAALAIPWWWVDGGAALMLMLQAAVDEGLGAGFLGAHALEGIAPLLGVPDGVEVLGVVTVGHPLPEEPTASVRRGRRPRSETTHHETWGG